MVASCLDRCYVLCQFYTMGGSSNSTPAVCKLRRVHNTISLHELAGATRCVKFCPTVTILQVHRLTQCPNSVLRLSPESQHLQLARKPSKTCRCTTSIFDAAITALQATLAALQNRCQKRMPGLQGPELSLQRWTPQRLLSFLLHALGRPHQLAAAPALPWGQTALEQTRC
jgi:hypothetical protein